MKNILIRSIILSTVIFAFIGCDDFLDEAPETFQTPQNFFETEDQINEAIAGIYNTNRGLASIGVLAKIGLITPVFSSIPPIEGVSIMRKWICS